MWPSFTPAAWSAAPTALRRSPAPSERSIAATPRVAGLVFALCAAAALGRAVGGDDPLNELVPDDVLASEADEADVLNLVEDVAHLDQSRPRPPLEVDLGDVAGDDELGPESEPGEE